MPTYDYACLHCRHEEERNVPIELRHEQKCPKCGYLMRKLLAAPMGRIAGQVVQGGGPDRFTADALGIPLKELPPGLKT